MASNSFCFYPELTKENQKHATSFYRHYRWRTCLFCPSRYFFLRLQSSGVTTEWHIGRLEDRKRSRPKVDSFSNHSRWRNLSKGSPQLRGALKIWKEVFPSNSEPKSCLQKADMNHTPQTRVGLKIETFHPGSSRRGAEAQNTSTHLSKVYGPWWW